MSAMWLWMQKVCPPRLSSRMIASLTTFSSHSLTLVLTSSLELGGVAKMLYVFILLSAIFRLLGIGVALILKMCEC